MRRDLLSAMKRVDVMSIALLVLYAAALFAGGASRLHELRLALVELAALPLLVIAMTRLLNGAQHPSGFALFILGAAVAVPLLQLMPVPPPVWTNLPGRNEAALALDLAGINPGWAPLTLTPDATRRSLLALIPPIAMFLGVRLWTTERRLQLIYILLGFASLSVVVGTAQLASGGAQLYPWPTTRPGNVVGFFANRNHLATLCLLAMPFAAVLGARALRHRERGQTLSLWLCILFLTLMIAALAVIRSRMGIALAGPTLVASLGAAWVASGGGRPKPLLIGLVGAVAVVVCTVSIFTVGPLISRFDTSGAREGRFENWPVVADAAATFLPIGSGLGSFDPVYRSVEPLERLDSTFFNQAHNDYLELWLETGWAGAALIITFLVWFSRRTWTAWRGAPKLDRDLQRASTIAIGVILAHSSVDYPLRTVTLTVILAMCCGILDLADQAGVERAERGRGRRRRKLAG